MSKTLFAPRLGAIYRINDNNVFRAGYGITYNPLPFSRPLRGFFPLTLASQFNAEEPYGWATTFEEGIPDVVGPDLSSGRLDLPGSYLMRTPAGDVSRSRIHSWNVSFERRLPWDVSVDMAYVGTAKNGGFTDIDANASDVPGGGATSRPLYDIRGNSSLLLWGPFAKSRYHSLQVAINRPFKNGLLLKGAYTLSRAKNEVDDDGWSQLTWSAPSLRDAITRWPATIARTSSTWRSSTSCRTRSSSARTRCSARSWAIGRSTGSTARCRVCRSRSLPRAQLDMPGNQRRPRISTANTR